MINSTESFIEKAVQVHGDKYNYSISRYVDQYTKVKIICKKHGVFEQRHYCHLNGYGCSICANSERRLTNNDFISMAINVHGNAYSYRFCDYKNSRTKVCITCVKHGNFMQLPRTHLKGSGCPICGGTALQDADDFFNDCKDIHKNRYSYNYKSFKNSLSKIDVFCKKHGWFSQVASEHKRGSGCNLCSSDNAGWTVGKFVSACEKNRGVGILYLVKIFNCTEMFYKIGITSRTVKKRYNNLQNYKYVEILSVEMDAKDAFNAEKSIIIANKSIKYTPSIDLCGKTECFSDIPDLGDYSWMLK